MPEKPRDVISLLGSQPSWAPYKLLPKGNGKHKKPPIDPTTGKPLEGWPDRPEFWTLTEAQAAAKRLSLPGVGLFTGNGLCAGDIDNCLAAGRLLPEARKLVERLKTYTEFSPSGKGLRLLFTCNLDGVITGGIYVRECRWADGIEGRIELYLERHFATFTNKPLGENLERPSVNPFCRPVAAISPQVLDELIVSVGFEKAEPQPTSPPRETPGTLSDADALRIHHKDPAFVHYWNGYPTGLRDTTRSGIRFALLQKLVFTCGGNLDQARRIAESSPFYKGLDDESRKQWERLFPSEYAKAVRKNPVRYGDKRNGTNPTISTKENVGSYSVPPSEEPPPEEQKGEPEPDPKWQKLLILGKKKKPLTCLSNVVTALTYAPEWCGTLSFNEFTLEILVRKPTPIGAKADHVWTDDDDRETAVWMQQHGVIATSKTVAEAVQVVAHRNPIHPLRDEIDALEWDGVPRLDAWLIDYAGAADMKYTRAVGACWVISMMARLYMPGCKSDYVLGLEGDQGIGKSMLLSILPGRKCFADRVSNLDTKDAMLEMAGILVVEMSELVNMKGATLEKFKAFVSSQDDRFRDPYGRRVAWHPRQCVLCATTNLTEPFTDPTGTRRIWPVRCGVIDIPGLRAVRKQLLAEARVRLKPQSPAISLDGIEGTGERWWLEDEELKKLAAAEQEDRYEPGVWDDNIVEWIAKPEQRWKREGSGTYATTLPVKPWDESEAGKVTITDILVHGLEKDIGHLTQADHNQVKRCLEHEKWRRHQDRTRSEARGKRFYYSPERGEKEFYKDGKRKPKSEGNS